MSASPISPELQSKIASWRLRAAEGTLTEAEMIEAVRYLRAGRLAAATAPAAAKRKRAAAEIPAAADMLSELENME